MGYASLVFCVSGARTSPKDHPRSLSRDPTEEYSEVSSDMICRGKYPQMPPNDLNGNSYSEVTFLNVLKVSLLHVLWTGLSMS